MKEIKSLSEININKNSAITLIMPHPDDETGYLAGFIQKAVSEKCRVSLLCLTNGENSTLRFGMSSNDSLSLKRSKELKEAAKILGVSKLVYFNENDGKISQNVSKISKKISNYLKKTSPDIIVTIEPEGIYGHSDHICLSNIITQLHNKKKYNFKLIYVTVHPSFKQKDWAIKMVGRSVKPLEPNICLKLTYKETFLKLKAFRSHRSQFKVTPAFLYNWHKDKLLRTEFIYIGNHKEL